ncbi:hypothetical protein AB3N61_02265 [Leptospira sp. WS58.C1]|uniref:hypothetical protein n=1 Tax=Leptospira TaxID=171 RepID=UPI0002BEF7E6|nr:MULTISPECIES: hypothetical protein [unclassified Leptospira]EMJ99937.1 hypothetical protein LEP1GSC192_1077 [Leptospira sp. B5-022]MCR1795389.1 hypothetical protein [Leptospira sp. id769339]
MTKYPLSKIYLTCGIAVIVIVFGIFLYSFLRNGSGVPVFTDRFEFKNLTRAEAEKFGVLGIPNGVTNYFIKRCGYKESWVVYSKYKVESSEFRKSLLERFKNHPGLNRRFDSYPKDWPENFDQGNCKPDWWEPCPNGFWAEIFKDIPVVSHKDKDGFYLCESGKELRWFVFHFRNIL